MSRYLIVRVLLAIHLTGMLIMAGTTLLDFVTFRTFWDLVDSGIDDGAALLHLMRLFGSMVRLGGAIIIVTGMLMLVTMRGLWLLQAWFWWKMFLVVLIVINGAVVGNKAGIQLRTHIARNASSFISDTIVVRNTLEKFYIIQLVLFILIIVISTVKPARGRQPKHR